MTRTPPPGALRLLRLAIPDRLFEPIAGDLEEAWHARERRSAAAFYWMTAVAIADCWWHQLRPADAGEPRFVRRWRGPLHWLDSLARDVRLAARMLRKNALVTAAAVASLALALGASVAAFALVDALMLRPLAVREPDRLVYLAFPTGTPERPEADTFNDPLFLRLRVAGRGRVDLFAMSTQVMRQVKFPDAGGEKERVRTQFVSGDAFERLGLAPALGRLFSGRDDVTPGAHPVAILSHAFWMRRFGGAPSVVGRSFTFEDRVFEIVGVTAPAFAGIEPGRPTDVWFPYAMYNPRAFGNADFGWFRILGRMRDDVRPAEAAAVLQASFTAFRRDRAGFGSSRTPEELARYLDTPLYARSAANGPSPLRRQFGRSLSILAAIAGLVLLIAGSNVANLFLARTAAREREMALRLSIGAGRGRLVQQLLVESALVAIAVCALGLLVAAAAAPSVVAMLASADDPVHLDLHPDWRLTAFVGTLVVLITALLGVVPAVRASAARPLMALQTAGPRSAARAGALRPFVALQVAFGLMVLFVGGLLVLSFARLSSIDPGFTASHVLLVPLEPVRRLDPDRYRAALRDVLDRLRALPGVQSVGAAEFNALGRAWTNEMRLPGNANESIESTIQPVSPGYFEAMRIRLVAGRTFERRDFDNPESTALVVNETFARKYFGAGAVVGQSLPTRFFESDAGPYEIVGVVADAKYDLRKAAAPTLYVRLSTRQNLTVHVRAAGDAAALAPRIREEVRAATPLLRAAATTTQDAAVAGTLIRERLLALLSGFFALVGLVLAAVGLYAVLSYAVMQRTREIGIRVALGARPRRVVGMVLADAGRTTLLGAAAGLAGGLYLSRFVEALLFDVTALGFWSLTLPLGMLTLTAIAAATLPARRAARVDPAVALRYE